MIQQPEQLRLAAALAHALPCCRLELRGPDGDSLCVGCRADCEISPCELRLALIQALGDEGGSRFAGVEAHLRDDPPTVCHLGLGVYSYRTDCCFGCLLATLLEPHRVAETVHESLQDEDPTFDSLAAEPLHYQFDEQLGVTLLYTRHRAGAYEELSGADEEHALHLAATCLAEELVIDDRAVRGWGGP